ncbi:hypothetical protein [Rickettsia felis]|uniref:hypothetical protein n=1 Tax=Rickettsia felis TaxID=42862 RepID=UPI0015859C38|nr:hypothetical protein [Rickettsia felis]
MLVWIVVIARSEATWQSRKSNKKCYLAFFNWITSSIYYVNFLAMTSCYPHKNYSNYYVM